MWTFLRNVMHLCTVFCANIFIQYGVIYEIQGNVRDFTENQGNVRELSVKKNLVREKLSKTVYSKLHICVHTSI